MGCAVADEPMSPGEIQRALERHDRALMDAVTTATFVREVEHLRNEIHESVSDCKERTEDVEQQAMSAIRRIETGKQDSRVMILQIVGFVVALVAAYIAAKGIK